MTLPDPLSFKTKPSRFSLVWTFVQEQGRRSRQEDAFAFEPDECFALADGVGGMPHGDIAAKLAVESVVWTYKLTKLKPFYWNDKKLLAGRLFRTANWRLFNKRREEGFENGLASTLVVVIFSERKFYVYHVGDTNAYLIRDGKLMYITRSDRGEGGVITKALGIAHSGPNPSFATYETLREDKIILTTDGVSDWVTEKDFLTILSKKCMTEEELTKQAKQLVDTAVKNGSSDNCSVCVICCLPGKAIIEV